jgi:prevent-host-death family protein
MATQISVSAARQSLPELLERARYGRERFVIERRGQPLAAVLPYEEYLALADALDDLLDARLAREALADLAAGETIPWEQVKRERAEAD